MGSCPELLQIKLQQVTQKRTYYMRNKHKPSNRSAGKPLMPALTVGYSRNSIAYFFDASSSVIQLPRNTRRFGASSSTTNPCGWMGCLRDVRRCWWLAANSDMAKSRAWYRIVSDCGSNTIRYEPTVWRKRWRSLDLFANVGVKMTHCKLFHCFVAVLRAVG